MADIIVSPSSHTVSSQRAQDIAEKYKNEGGDLASMTKGLPADVRAEVKAIIKRSGIAAEEATQLRKARITELMLHDDPDVTAKGVALSQKEEGVGLAPAVQNNFQFNHWERMPPDGRELLAEKEVIDVKPERE